jgi:hypothetical protein
MQLVRCRSAVCCGCCSENEAGREAASVSSASGTWKGVAEKGANGLGGGLVRGFRPDRIARRRPKLALMATSLCSRALLLLEVALVCGSLASAKAPGRGAILCPESKGEGGE